VKTDRLTITNSIFLYFFLLACVTGTGYFFYTVWVAPYFPQKRKSTGKTGEKRTPASKRVETQVTEEASSTGAGASSATTYNADWIPSHHIARPEARKVKGRSKARA
jgi:hypothetical protein